MAQRQRAPRKTEAELRQERLDAWVPKTRLGMKVKNAEVTDIDLVLDSGVPIMELEIVETLVPDLEHDLLLIGQAKGKFGGGQRRVFKQTQRQTRQGSRPSFATYAVVGNKNGYVGVGYGKSRETVPAREKAVRNAKLNVFRIVRGNGSWEDSSNIPHSIPYKVSGKCGSVEVELIPAPQGTGLVCAKELQKILRLAGIQNVWSKTKGQTKVTINLIKACEAALRQLAEVKMTPEVQSAVSAVKGKVTANE